MDQSDYIMPVVEAEFFTASTERAFHSFFQSQPACKDGHPVVSLKLTYTIGAESNEKVRCHIWTLLTVERSDGKLFEVEIDDLHADTIPHIKDLLFEIGIDRLHEQMLGLLPWHDEYLNKRMRGSEYSLHKARDFALLTPEFLPTWIKEDDNQMRGPNATLEGRQSVCQLILPPTSTSHDAIARQAKLSEIERLATDLFNFHSEIEEHDDQLSLKAIDFDNIQKDG